MQMDETAARTPFAEREAAFREHAYRRCWLLRQTEQTIEVLASAAHAHPSHPQKVYSADYWHRTAIHYGTVMAVPAARSACILVASGYPLEAVAHRRMLHETLMRVERSLDDDSGGYASAWLAPSERQRRKKLPDSIYSQVTHPNATKALHFRGEDPGPNSISLNVGPADSDGFGNAVLAEVAADCIALLAHFEATWDTCILKMRDLVAWLGRVQQTQQPIEHFLAERPSPFEA